MSAKNVKIGIIGGSGMSDPKILLNATEKTVTTPFGKPSDSLKIGEIKGVSCVLLARHGRAHSIMPTNINFRANIWALKEEGCTHLLVTTACGSLQGEMKPGDVVILDQFIDRTQKRSQTFFDGEEGHPPGICHLPMADPFCKESSKMLYDSAKELNISCHNGGTIVTIEGPRFSSRAESKLFHSWGAHCINMTTVPEVVLAKEAGLCYAAMALVTDYDSWRDGEESVTVDAVMKTFKKNASNATDILMKAIPLVAAQNWDDTIRANQDIVKCNTLLPHDTQQHSE